MVNRRSDILRANSRHVMRLPVVAGRATDAAAAAGRFTDGPLSVRFVFACP